MNRINVIMLACLMMSVTGCKKDAADQELSPRTPSDSTSGSATSNEKASESGDHGKPIELGNAKIGIYDVRASRDMGPIHPGKDAPIDVWLTGDVSKVRAVRFWIGTASGTESIKARAEIENKAEPNHWHTHAEIPDPMPAGSRLWVEIETKESTETASFELAI